MSRLLPVLSACAIFSSLVLFGIAVGPGCQTRCNRNSDCSDGFCNVALGRCETECFTDQDCREPPECQANPLGCTCKGFLCDGNNRCVGPCSFPRVGTVTEVPIDTVPTEIDGWDDPPGSGHAFIVNAIAIAGKDRGFDIDGACDAEGCIDNYLWRLGELGNDQIRQGLLAGESLLLIELAGLDEPYRGDDESVTLKIYGVRDADDPVFSQNNFKVPPGQTTCCEFKINPQSLNSPPPQARARAPARIERGRLRSLAPVPIQFTLTVGVPPHPAIRLERVLFSGRIPSTLTEFNEGLLGGAVPINTLAQTENPYCRTVNPRCPVQFNDSTLIDLVSTLLGPRPDVDLDFDGIECVPDTNGDTTIDLCCDGVTGTDNCNSFLKTCPGRAIDPINDKPWSCALHPQIADGYSVGITFTAVAATIVGVGQ